MESPPTEIRAELERFHPESFGWAMACCRWNEVEALETLQTTYLKVLEGRARFRGESAFRTWLFAVIRRTAIERRRRERARRLGLVRLFEARTDPRPAGPEREAASGEVARRLRNALSALAARQREVLHLVFYAGLSVEEAAGVMGISVGSARTHYARGKTGLRQKLEGAKQWPERKGEEP